MIQINKIALIMKMILLNNRVLLRMVILKIILAKTMANQRMLNKKLWKTTIQSLRCQILRRIIAAVNRRMLMILSRTPKTRAVMLKTRVNKISGKVIHRIILCQISKRVVIRKTVKRNLKPLRLIMIRIVTFKKVIHQMIKQYLQTLSGNLIQVTHKRL